MKLFGSLFMVIAVTLFAKATELQPNQQNFHQRLQRIAGKNAFDCGRAENRADYSAVSDCALKLFQGKSPFVAQFRMLGIDPGYKGFADEGFAMNSSGDLFIISNFDRGRGVSLGKIVVGHCAPHSLTKTNQDALDCLLPS